jgi:hypothetical protein
MCDKNGQPLYWLVFCTNHLRGLEEMKRAMWAVEGTGEFRFSDEDNPDQLKQFDETYNQGWLAEALATRLAGKTLSAAKVREYVLTDTPCYLFKAALKALEVGRERSVVVLKAPIGSKPGTYPDNQLADIEIRFAPSLFS